MMRIILYYIIWTIKIYQILIKCKVFSIKVFIIEYNKEIEVYYIIWIVMYVYYSLPMYIFIF